MKKWSLGGLIALAAAVVASCAHAPEAPMTIAGGELDPNYPWVEIYQETPLPDEQPPGRACQAARTYLDTVYARRFADVANLFAADAVIFWPRLPNGEAGVQVIEGRRAIVAFYRSNVPRVEPSPIPVTMLGNDTDCMAEVAARFPIDGTIRYRLGAINHFTVNSRGQVVRLISFHRRIGHTTTSGDLIQ